MRLRAAHIVTALAMSPTCWGIGHAQSSLPRAPGTQVTTVTPPGQYGWEPSIAVNPAHPNQVAATWGPGLWTAYSNDFGRTFTPVRANPVVDSSGGDVALTYDDRGTLILALGSVEKLSPPNYWGQSPMGSGVWLRRSPDGGTTWDSAAVTVKVWPNGHPAPEAMDMQRIWADNQPRSPYRGNLYMAWISWQIDKAVVMFTRSTDHGTTWSTPRRISTHAGHPRDDNGGIAGIIGAVAPDGSQYVVWSDGLTLALATSRDGGQTFGPSRAIIDVDPPYFGGFEGIAGVVHVMGFPQIGVDNKTGALYVAWSDTRNGDADVFISRSLDRGATWSQARRVNDDPVHNGADQFFQWMAVDPTDGAIYVQFYDRRDDPEGRKTTVTLARSTDGGRTFKNYGWSETPFTGENAFLGDYMWLVAYGGHVYGTWAESLSGPGVSLYSPGMGIPPGSPCVIRVGVADFSTH